jgi:Xaa-Pro aminopeptidase
MQPLYQERISRFRHGLKEGERRAFLVTKPQNLQYLAGFRGDSTWLLVTGSEKLLFTDSRYLEQAREQCSGWQALVNKEGLVAALKEQAKRLDIRELAFDHSHVTVEMYQRLELALGKAVKLLPQQDPCGLLRQVKDSWELEQMQKAAAIADQALALLRPAIRPGAQEKELALELEYRMNKLGSEGPSFDTIVAGGPQGALPHARPTDYRLKEGDMVTLDFGALVNGYHSDMTRTFILGKGHRLQEERYRLVLSAQEKALAAVLPGATVRGVDALAREYLAQAGYSDYFGHGLGHSVGLEIHENPRFSPLAEDVPLQPGMVMTVEPGIYLPGWGGLRIEDSVAITADSINFLTNAPKTLEEITII